MKIVRCHRFACVEEDQTQQQTQKQSQRNQRPRRSFRPRKPKPLRLRDCLSLDDVPYPDLSIKRKQNPHDTLIVIQTEYAGIQYPDALQARGLYQVKPRLPYVPGMDAVGTVTKVVHPASTASTASTARIRPGDRVMATLLDAGGTGGLSEVVVAPLKHVYKIPDRSSLSATSALFKDDGDGLMSVGDDGAVFANIGRNYFAAYHSLVEVGGIDPDPSSAKSSNRSKIVLVTGASGGVGMATIELAKAMGCTVLAGVGNHSKAAGPESVGADAVYRYGRTKPERRAFRSSVQRFCQQQQQQHQSHGVDLVVDVVMGDLFEDALVGCLKPLGTIALVGFAAGQRKIRPGVLLVKEARVAGSLWSSVASEATEDNLENRYSTMVRRILGYFADGSISGRVDKLIPVWRFVEAFEIFEENKGRGNTVVSFVDEVDKSRRSRL